MSAAGCWPPTVRSLYYQPARLLQIYQQNPKYLNRLYLHVVFHCVFRHLWLKGRREPQLWSLACDIAVENVIDSLNRASVKRPLTYVRQNAYQQITAEEKVVAAAPAYRWLTRQTPGVLRQLEREFVADDHRLWPKDAPEQPQQMPTPLPQKTWQKIGERMQTELDLRDKEAGEGADALKQQVKAANRSRRSYKDFLRRFCVHAGGSQAGPGRVRPELLHLRPGGVRQPAPHRAAGNAGKAKRSRNWPWSSTPAIPPPVRWCGPFWPRPTPC